MQHIEIIDKELIQSIGKIPIDLDVNEETPKDLKYAVAVGFPESLKKVKIHKEGSYISTPHSTVLAELSGTPVRKFTMHSSVEEKVSSMSGGPIFWHDGIKHNILGIFFESPNSQYDVFDEYQIVLSGEFADSKTIKRWIEELFP